MKHVFLDTNVLVDFAIEDRPGNSVAKQIIAAACSKKLMAYTSTQSLVDLTYFYTKSHKDLKQSVGGFLQDLRKHIKVCDTCKGHLDMATSNYYYDFEDAVQTSIAIDNCCDLIISGDKGFDGTFGPPVVSPDEFCREYYVE